MPTIISQVIVSCHGVRSFGEWGDVFASDLKSDPRFSNTLFLSISYPWLPAILGWTSTWFPFLRHYYTNWMERQLVCIQTQFPNVPMDVQAHSFGAWLVFHAVQRSAECAKMIHLHKFIMIGSVLCSDDPLLPVTNGQIEHLINHWSSNDVVARFAPAPFGRAGQEGLRQEN